MEDVNTAMESHIETTSEGSESLGSTETETSEATEAPESEPVVETPKYKVKVDGQELEVSVDDLLSGYQLKHASDKRFQEAAEIRKHTEAIILGLKEDPVEVLRLLGVDVDNVTESYLANKLQRELMDPRERELLETKERLRLYEEQEAEKQRTLAEQQEQEEINKYSQEIDAQIGTALQTSKLPRNAYSVSRVLDIMVASHDAGKPLPPEQAVRYAYEESRQESQHFLESLEGQELLEFLGEKALKKIRQADVARVKNPVTSSSPRPTPQPRQQEKVSSWEEFTERLRALQRSGY